MPSATVLAAASVTTIAVFLIVDAIWLKAFMGPFFHDRIGHIMRAEPRLEVAAGFYLCFALGIVYFAVVPALNGGGLGLAILNGALLGFLAYGTFEATSMAIFRDYQWSLVIVDTLWGSFVTALSAASGYFAASALG